MITKFWESVNTISCPHCKKKVTQIRKEGTSKFFLSSSKKEYLKFFFLMDE